MNDAERMTMVQQLAALARTLGVASELYGVLGRDIEQPERAGVAEYAERLRGILDELGCGRIDIPEFDMDYLADQAADAAADAVREAVRYADGIDTGDLESQADQVNDAYDAAVELADAMEASVRETVTTP